MTVTQILPTKFDYELVTCDIDLTSGMSLGEFVASVLDVSIIVLVGEDSDVDSMITSSYTDETSVFVVVQAGIPGNVYRILGTCLSTLGRAVGFMSTLTVLPALDITTEVITIPPPLPDPPVIPNPPIPEPPTPPGPTPPTPEPPDPENPPPPFSIFGQLADGFVGEPYFIHTTNGMIGTVGGSSPYATWYGRVALGVYPASRSSIYTTISGIPHEVSTAVPADVTITLGNPDSVTDVWDNAVTIAPKPDYSLLDFRFLTYQVTWKSWHELSIAGITLGMRSRAGVSSGLVRGEFRIQGTTSNSNNWFGVHAGAEGMPGTPQGSAGALAFQVPNVDGVYAVELNANTGDAVLRNSAGTILRSGNIGLGNSFDGKYRLGFYNTVQADHPLDIKVNFGTSAWETPVSPGYGGIPNEPIIVNPSWRVDVPLGIVLQPYGANYKDIFMNRASSGPFFRDSYLCISDFSFSSGKKKVYVQMEHTGAGRAGFCVDTFVRSSGRLGDPGTANSFGMTCEWYTGNIHACKASLYWCFGGVAGSAVVEDVPIQRGTRDGAIMLFDMDAGTCKFYRPDHLGVNVFIYEIVGIPSDDWFVAVAGPGTHTATGEGNSAVPQMNVLHPNPVGFPEYEPWQIIR